jgi:hypothetical protein
MYFLVEVLIKDKREIVLYETVPVDLEPDQKWYELKLKLRGINIKDVGTIQRNR